MLWAALCITANSGCQCPLWVKSRHWSTFNRCLLYPRKRTWFSTVVMSAKCHKRTLAWCGTCALLRCVIAHLVQRSRKRRRRWGWHGAVALVDCLVQIISGVIRQPHFALIILPDQRLSAQIDC